MSAKINGCEIRIGTSGFYYDDWKGAFYPAGMANNDFLTFYTEHFSALELNFSYYRLPEARRTQKMVEKSQDTSRFIVKAFREMTHEAPQKTLEEVVTRFMDGITPLIDAGRLGGILLQFPQGFGYTRENRVYLKTLIDAMGSRCPLFVEFRRRDWLKESVFNTLEALGVGLVCVDEPRLPALPPPLTVLTADTGYIRFHGRNRKNWYGTDSSARYDYLYSEEELCEWVPKIKRLAEKARLLFVFFNNHAKARAVTNARMLINLLS